MGTILGLAVVAGVLYLMFKAFQSQHWHAMGGGDRKARAEYARLSRENPDSPDARLSEAEFVEKFVNQMPGMFRYVGYSLLLLIVGLPVSCSMG